MTITFLARALCRASATKIITERGATVMEVVMGTWEGVITYTATTVMACQQVRIIAWATTTTIT